MGTNERQPGILALLGNPTPMQPLLAHLRQLGMHIDVTTDLAGARSMFFAAGGHDCLLIAPDVRPGLASQVAQTLRSVDPDLPMASFAGELPAHRRANDAVLALHPGARAGTGACVRYLRSLRLR